MIDDEMLDGFLTGGFLPGVRSVAVVDARGTAIGTFDARREDATEDILMAAGVQAGQEACVWFFPAGQTSFQRPRNRWNITDSGGDGSAWTVLKDDLVMQQRGVAVVATRDR